MYARIENGEVIEYPIPDLQARFPDTSLPTAPANDFALPAGYVYVWPAPLPSFDPDTQMVTSALPQNANGRWETGYVVVDLTADQIAQKKIEQAALVQQNRLAAYQAESDPIFFKWQRGEATQQEWLDKIAEIKARFPMPA